MKQCSRFLILVENRGFVYKNDVNHKYATSPDVKCGIVERLIRTLKSRIWKYFTRNKTNRYIDVLPDLVKAINNSTNRTIKRTPASVTNSNQTDVWNLLYSTSKKSKQKLYYDGARP